MSASLPAAEIVIACHTPERNVQDAVASVLDHNENVAARVVAHNVDPGELWAVIDPRHHDGVVMDELRDGLRSPSGPFSHGIDTGRSEWFGILGSDDVLEPGAVDSWRRLALRTRAQYVIPRLRREERRFPTPTPPVRAHQLARILAGAAPDLDPIRDRLVFRSAPLGLIEREFFTGFEHRLEPGLNVGGDVHLTTQLMLHARTAFDATGPAYLVRDSASDRTTLVIRPLSQQFGFFETTFAHLSSDTERHAVALKFLRIHIFSALVVRSRPEHWSTAQREELARWTQFLLGQSRRVRADLSVAEERLVQQCLAPYTPHEDLLAASRARGRHASVSAVLPSHPLRLLAPQGSLRTVAGSALNMLVPRRRR
ncbi:hypothetical protein [Brachybacterium hainanense]|uniref:Glycosyltransferase 2-like domain-containing protein n=1 Tax=Brachybacterium hainanense TaxID=1541174 RepID=A0ABV6REQ8_9MICO